ncbi:Tat proofreading chaperone DmsD [Consotaella salsifontis]|uniref:Chaperone TorD involved in molybdoenzyme TorA maturation n=1 Tax=Consotaella salsifontis TaxID=1365950 RepID=A0A1T4SP38_9HYPH|nr:Tat proofreading chaperone DmsD [Consotaella salsifontis]SKA29952.1 chaperone TorD involved in molybdoenzyme TorA maturation [Consotaella salsifontis]
MTGDPKDSRVAAGDGVPLRDPANEEISACLAVLGALFRSSPDDPSLAPVLALLADPDFSREWPLGEPQALASIQERMRQAGSTGEMKEAWQKLFIGPDHFDAPPWGSVYLDKESVLFGDSTMALRSFLAGRGIAVRKEVNEPEDHIGLLLQLASGLAARGDEEALRELLAEHVLPWSGRYCQLLAANAGHPFYAGLADLAALSLAYLAEHLGAAPAKKALHF